MEAVVSMFAVLTFSVETRISRLCARRTLEGAWRTLYSGVGRCTSFSSPNLCPVSAFLLILIH